MKTYIGGAKPSGNRVSVVDNETGNTEPLTHIVRHSPDGFSWGFGGSGPAELAHCLLVDHLGHEVEPEVYQRFKFDVIAAIRQPTWTITGEFIDVWLRENSDVRRIGRSETEHRQGFTADLVQLDEMRQFVAETEMLDNEVELLNVEVECEVCGHGPTPAVHMVRERDGWVCWPCSRGEGSR